MKNQTLSPEELAAIHNEAEATATEEVAKQSSERSIKLNPEYESKMLQIVGRLKLVRSQIGEKGESILPERVEFDRAIATVFKNAINAYYNEICNPEPPKLMQQAMPIIKPKPLPIEPVTEKLAPSVNGHGEMVEYTNPDSGIEVHSFKNRNNPFMPAPSEDYNNVPPYMRREIVSPAKCIHLGKECPQCPERCNWYEPMQGYAPRKKFLGLI